MNASRRELSQSTRKSPATTKPTGRGLRLPLLVGTAVTLAILLPGLYLWRTYQVKQGADAFAARAEELAKEESWAKSAEYLFLYLRLRPDDADARLRLAETYGHLAGDRSKISRAIELYYQALAAAGLEQKPGIRQRLAELLIQAEEFTRAKAEAEKLVEDDPDDAKAHRALAIALFGQSRSASESTLIHDGALVGQQLEKANRLNPGDVEIALMLADVDRGRPQLQSEAARALTDDERTKRADEYINALITAQPQKALAYLARYQYRSQYGLDGAEADLAKAVELDANNPVVLVTAGQDCLRKVMRGTAVQSNHTELLDRAAGYYESARAASKQSEAAYLGLGEIAALRGDSAASIATWTDGLKECGENSIVLNLRLADALIGTNSLSDAERHIDRVKATAQNLRQRGLPPADLGFALLADLLQARVALTKGQTDAAIKILDSVANDPIGSRGENPPSFAALMTLGNLYASQGQQELAIKAYDNAAVMQPKSPEPRVAAAAMWMGIDRPQLAEEQLRRAGAIDDSPENRMLLAAAALRNQLKLDPAAQNWKLVEDLLSRAKDATKRGSDRPWRLHVLEAEFLLRRSEAMGDHKRGQSAALAALHNNAAVFAQSSEGLATLATLYERLGDAVAADQTLVAVRNEFAAEPDSYLTSATILASRKQFADAHAVLNVGQQKVSESNRPAIVLGKASLLLQEGRNEEAWQVLSHAQSAKPSDRRLLERTIELALEQQKFAEAEALEKTLGELPGVATSDWKYYRALRLLIQAVDSHDQKIAEAQSIAEEICRERPTFARGQTLLGGVFDKQGPPEKAVEAYERAIQLGDQRLVTYERLLMLLYQLGRFSDADKYLAKLSTRSAVSSDLSTLQISLAMRAGERDRALELARLGVAQRPADPLAQIWLAQLLIAAEQPAEAEKALRKAIELGPKDPRTYGAAVNYFVRTKQPDRARAAIEQCARKIEAPPVQREMILAAGYEAIGDHPLALAHFQAAAKSEPENADIYEDMAQMMSTSDPAEAEKSLRHALELNPRSDRARRMLAELLANRGGKQRWEEAQRLATSTAEGNQTDQRLEALLLARRGGVENLKRAQDILEGSLATPQGANDRANRLLLAYVRDAQGAHDAARSEYQRLASYTAPRAEDLAAYVDFLLRTDELAEAEKQLGRLEQIETNRLSTIGFRVRWLRAKNRGDEIGPLLESTAATLLEPAIPGGKASAEQKLQTSLAIGDLYFSARRFRDAERWHRRAYDIDSKYTTGLARSLVELGRIDEAVSLCVKAGSADKSPLPAVAVARILLRSPKPTATIDAAESLIANALTSHPKDTGLLSAVAALRVVQGRADEAIGLYRKLLDLEPQNVETLNNLATMLAESPEHREEALKRIDEAIEVAGDQPGLLDTKGTILVALGRAQEGVQLLSAAASAPNGDPRFHLHLAVGHFRAGDMTRAREALATAKARELGRQILTDSDSKILAELDERFR